MSKPLIPPDRLREWTDELSENKTSNKNILKLMLKQQRSLDRWTRTNARGLEVRQGVPLRTLATLLRIYDLCGGKVGPVAPSHIEDAEQRISAVIPSLLPADAGVPERLRQVPWRAQPFVLDELLADLFDAEDPPGEPLDLFKLFIVVWVALEAIDEQWKPPADFDGAAAYERA